MIKIKDKTFVVYLSAEKLLTRIQELANEISNDYKDKDPLVIGVLNGSMYFLTELTLQLQKEVEIAFVKYKSYEGTTSSGEFQVAMPFDERVAGRDVLLIEDIVDTGRTIQKIKTDIEQFRPASVEVISLLLKPDVFKDKFPVKYVGFEIPEKFVLGFGLDYDGRGRNLRDIYVLSE
ncbi:MAG: hypoxanthine phosphoribosyltransferase [Bacteroidota bacterium]